MGSSFLVYVQLKEAATTKTEYMTLFTSKTYKSFCMNGIK